jgi:hypothetical protein
MREAVLVAFLPRTSHQPTFVVMGPGLRRDDQLWLTRSRAHHRHCERSEAIHGAANAVSEEWIASTEAAHLIGDLDVDRAQRANFERKVGESSKIISEVRLLPRSPPLKNKNSRVFRPGHPEL